MNLRHAASGIVLAGALSGAAAARAAPELTVSDAIRAAWAHDARLQASSREEFLASSFRAFFQFVADDRGGSQPAPERFRMDSPEVLAGFAELREDISDAMARGLLPSTDAAALAAALTGVAFELAERIKAGANVEATTRFATALFLGGLEALPKNPEV